VVKGEGGLKGCVSSEKKDWHARTVLPPKGNNTDRGQSGMGEKPKGKKVTALEREFVQGFEPGRHCL